MMNDKYKMIALFSVMKFGGTCILYLWLLSHMNIHIFCDSFFMFNIYKTLCKGTMF